MATYCGCGPWSKLFAIRVQYWDMYFERSMMASARAQDLEEALDGVEASPRDLVRGGSNSGRGDVEFVKTFEFGPSLTTEANVNKYEGLKWFDEGRARAPKGESMLRPEVGEAVVFRDFFICGLCMPTVRLVREVLEDFSV